MIPIKTSSVRGLAKSAGKPVGGGGCAGAGAGACAKSAFKAFKCIVEMWPDTLGKLTGLASVIGHLPVRGWRKSCCVKAKGAGVSGF